VALYNPDVMNLITRCPACRTMFKVVPDQLRISGGWVRCGQCDEVFDASANLQDSRLAEVPQPEPVDIVLEMPQVLADEPLEPVAAPEQPVSDDDVLASFQPRPDAVPAWEPVLSTPEEVAEELAGMLEPGLPSEPVEPVEPLAPSFLREAPDHAAVAPSPWLRFGWKLAAVLLSLTLLVQWLVHERDRIAAAAPGVKPVVEMVCVLMQCRVASLRQIESVLIDSSSFNKLRADVYRLNLTLKNAAETDVALPAIELALTDAQDQALMRRVFLASELGVPSDVLAAGSESAVSLALGIKTNGNAERIAGYRVLAFYP